MNLEIIPSTLITSTIADAAKKTGRSRNDFEIQEIGKERYEKLKAFLS
jgi:hypothetical protein